MKRCAIYTRKSSAEGLDQHFNSLDAQRESCEAYIRSQAGEDWTCLPDRYDDGGYSGGSMERPGLQVLLSDVRSGKVDVIVVYKIDRLTRSLPDFARIVEIFDAAGASFVSVTQAFNTTTSMGRLTLNVLLSFAQFEREVTGERIRDKIAASKAKGLWMGGLAPLGYDLPTNGSRVLVVNEAEAETVRCIFQSYLGLGSVHRLLNQLNEQGVLSKRRMTRGGRAAGGLPFSRGALFHLLQNRVYVGDIVHKSERHPGQHEPIIDDQLFENVQAMLASHRRARTQATIASSPLAGRLFDDRGRPLSATHSRGARGDRYRYYVARGPGPRLRISAKRLEEFVRHVAVRVGFGEIGEQLFYRIIVGNGELHLHFPAAHSKMVRRNMQPGMILKQNGFTAEQAVLVVEAPFGGSPGQPRIQSAATIMPKRDEVLIRALRAAHSMLECTRRGVPHLQDVPAPRYDRRLVRLAFLAPDIQRAIISGTQPSGLRLEDLVRNPMPLSWREQKRWIHRSAS